MSAVMKILTIFFFNLSGFLAEGFVSAYGLEMGWFWNWGGDDCEVSIWEWGMDWMDGVWFCEVGIWSELIHGLMLPWCWTETSR